MTATMDEPRTEVALGPLAQIPLGEGREFVVAGKRIAVFHTRKGVYATEALCPHRGGPLADGLIGGTTVVCPYHAWKFDLATGEPRMGACGVATYPVRLDERGALWLTVGGPDEDRLVPGDACADAPGYPILAEPDITPSSG